MLQAPSLIVCIACALQVSAADERLLICNSSKTAIVPSIVYQDERNTPPFAEWVIEAARVLHPNSCMGVSLSATARHGYIQVLKRLPDSERWFFPIYDVVTNYRKETGSLVRERGVRSTETRVCVPKDNTLSLTGAPVPPRKRALGTAITLDPGEPCKNGDALVMNLLFTLEPGLRATSYVREAEVSLVEKE